MLLATSAKAGFWVEAALLQVNSSNTPHDPVKYFNKRAEMWGDTRDAIKAQIEQIGRASCRERV
jgi:hypothetical protein